MGLAYQEGMQGDAHDPPALGPLTVELVELRLADVGEVVAFIVVVAHHGGVVKLDGVRHRHQLAAVDLDGDRLVVVHPVGVVDESGFGHQVGGSHGAGDGRAEHSLQLLAGVQAQGCDGVAVELPLLVFVVGVEVAGVVDAVAHVIVVALHHGLADFREVLQDGHVQGDAALDAVLVQRFQHPPEAHPVAIVAVGILLHVGIGSTGPGIADTLVLRQVLVMLHVGRNPEGHPGIVGPLDRGALNDWAVINSVVGFCHGWASLIARFKSPAILTANRIRL